MVVVPDGAILPVGLSDAEELRRIGEDPDIDALQKFMGMTNEPSDDTIGTGY